MANNVLPARAGEFIRAYAGARLEGVPFSMAFATVVIDRVLDGLTVSAAFLLVLLIQPLPDEIKVAGYGAGALYLAALLVLVGLIVRQGDTLHLLSAVLSPLPARIRHFVLRTTEAFVGGLSVFRSAPLVLLATLISVAIWTGYALGLYLMFLAFGLSLSLLQALVVLLILTIVLTIPASPGFIGTMHAAITFGLRLYGADPSQAFAVAIVYHITQYVPITLSGFVALWLERLSMTELTHATSEK
jgi:uncharacterized protein (TIRG00374 family)